jgi:hypothetical protein
MAFSYGNINIKNLEAYPGKLLIKVYLNKLRRRIAYKLGLRGPMDTGYERIVSYNGIDVYDEPNLHGDGIKIGPDYIRVLLELGFSRVNKIFEFCSGPGYIGTMLLANGFCKKLVLADINPEAIRMQRKTIEKNKLENYVKSYHSDVFDDIPNSEKFDLVVGNPPHFQFDYKVGNTKLGEVNLKAYDPDWKIHKKFFLNVKNYMKPGGYVVLQENTMGGMDVNTFKNMIETGGGKFIDWVPTKKINGYTNPIYYLVVQY